MRRLAVAGTIASLVVAACATSTQPSASPIATSDAGAGLYGAYTATIPEGVNASPGEWTLTITAGSVSFTRPDGQSFSPGAVQELTATEIALANSSRPVDRGARTERPRRSPPGGRTTRARRSGCWSGCRRPSWREPASRPSAATCQPSVIRGSSGSPDGSTAARLIAARMSFISRTRCSGSTGEGWNAGSIRR